MVVLEYANLTEGVHWVFPLDLAAVPKSAHIGFLDDDMVLQQVYQLDLSYLPASLPTIATQQSSARSNLKVKVDNDNYNEQGEISFITDSTDSFTLQSGFDGFSSGYVITSRASMFIKAQNSRDCSQFQWKRSSDNFYGLFCPLDDVTSTNYFQSFNLKVFGQKQTLPPGVVWLEGVFTFSLYQDHEVSVIETLDQYVGESIVCQTEQEQILKSNSLIQQQINLLTKFPDPLTLDASQKQGFNTVYIEISFANAFPSNYPGLSAQCIMDYHCVATP